MHIQGRRAVTSHAGRGTISRRTILAGISSAGFMHGWRIQNGMAAPPPVTIPGAIRWDAWYAPGAIHDSAVAALAPQQWHFRAPWFARVLSADRISIDGGHQAIVDAEIEYAASAGLRYWAYVWYGRDHPMQAAWRLYQSSRIKSRMKWCHILQLSNQGGYAGFKASIPLYIEHLGQRNYQRVLGGKPVVFLFLNNTRTLQNWGGASVIGDALREFRAAVEKSYQVEPYLVLLAAPAALAFALADAFGCDAISTYVPVTQPDNTVHWSDQEA